MFDSGTTSVFVSALAHGRLAEDLPRVQPTHVISVLDPGTEVDLALGGTKHLTLRLRDHVVPAPDAFSKEHVHALVEFLLKDVPARLLVHCHQGQSRSPAVAYVALAVLLGPGRESEAFDRVRRACAHPWPNRLIVETADATLGRKGELVKPLHAFREKLKGRGSVRNPD